MSCKHNVGGVRPQPVYLGGKRDVGEVKWQPFFFRPCNPRNSAFSKEAPVQ